MALKIFSYPKNPRVYRSQIAGKYNGVEIETPEFAFGVDNKKPEFLLKNPNGKVPVMETPEGCIWESNAIARYVASLNDSGKLFGSSLYEAALVNQWIDWCTNEVDLPASVWLYPIMGLIPNHPQATSKAKGDIRAALGVLNKHLLTRTFMVGERVTLADIVLATSLLPLYTTVLDAGFRKQFTNTNRWFTTCVNQPMFKSIIGDVTLCTKMAVAPAPEKTEEPKKKEAAKPQKKEAAKPKEEAPAKPKRTVNPLDQLPPTKFDLEDWKRKYMGTDDTRGDTVPWFWEHLDREGFSIWFADYKYPEDNEKMFMTCNLVGGYVQRLDSLRKYGFGVLVILGDEPKLDINCMFVVRGQDLPFELSDCPDSGSYEFRKADLEKDKQLIDDFLCCDGDALLKGRTNHNQYKIFR